MEIIEKCQDLSNYEINLFNKNGYVCVDTETTGLNYKNDILCTVQLFCDDYAIIIKIDDSIEYMHLKELFLSNKVIKIFHNAVFDVSFLMERFKLISFGKLVCTKITSKIVNGIEHNNSLKSLLKEYLKVEIDKKEQLSDWTKKILSESQKEYAINDVKYLLQLWRVLHEQLVEKKLEKVALNCFEFIPNYKNLTDMGIENIFIY